MPGRKIFLFILPALLLGACGKGVSEGAGTAPAKELTVIFATTTGLAGDGYNEPGVHLTWTDKSENNLPVRLVRDVPQQ